MKKRIITATLLILILGPAVVVPSLLNLLQVLLLFITIGASYELLHMYDQEKKLPLGIKIATVVLTVLLYCSIVSSIPMGTESLVHSLCGPVFNVLSPIVVISSIFIVYGALMILVPSMNVQDIGKLFVATFYVGVCAAAFTVIRLYGVRFIVYLLLITILTDIFALVFGINFGKHKMAPVTSPKKTWEGAIGGTATALVVACAFVFIYPLISDFFGAKIDSFYEGVGDLGTMSTVAMVVFTIFMTLAMSICSQIGDLIASKLKRNYGIKDYSNIFPGHGGILDRFDSAFFASAILLVFLLIAIGF